jgi:hypothetical protein
VKLILRFLAALAALVVCGGAHSETAICVGTVKTVAHHAGGWVVVAVGPSTSILMCNLDSQSFVTSPQSCKAYLALAIAVQAQNKSATLYVDNAPTSNCADIPFFHQANTRYFQ